MPGILCMPKMIEYSKLRVFRHQRSDAARGYVPRDVVLCVYMPCSGAMIVHSALSLLLIIIILVAVYRSA
jgi:hypothetical protein